MSTEKLPERLARLATEIMDWQSSQHFVVEQSQQDAVIVGLTLLRAMTIQSMAVLALVGSGHAAATGADQRALLEAWLDLRYLLKHGDRVRNAQRFQIFGLLELHRFLKAQGETPDNLAKLQGKLDRQKASMPTVYAEVEAEVAKGTLYWSGLRRLPQLREVAKAWPGGTDALLGFYKLASWEAHHVMVLLRDVEVKREDDRVELTFGESPAATGADVDAVCAQTWLLLNEGWQVFRQSFPDVQT